MKQVFYTVIENTCLADGIWRMKLAGDTTAFTAPGQFLNLKLQGRFLRRPISVYDWDDSSVTIIYKTLGHGTEQMTEIRPGTVMDTLTGLGNGFDTSRSGSRPLLIGGGVGIPPMYHLAKELLSQGKNPIVVLGFNGSADVFCVDEFAALGIAPVVATADGSVGIRGFVTDAVKDISDYSYFYTCGPMPMLRALEQVLVSDGEYSFEERMGCGFGACMGCTCKTKSGYKRICKDGPVMRREEVLWQ